MDNPWNPKEPSSSESEPARSNEPNADSGSNKDPSGIKQSPVYSPNQPPQNPPGQAPNPWAAPSGEGASWARPQAPKTTENPTYRPPAAGAGGSGGWGQAPPPSNFSFASDPLNTTSKQGTTNGSKIGLAIIVVLLMIGSGAIGGLVADSNNKTSGTTRTVAPITSDTTEPASQPLAKVAAAVQPSVVSIEISSRGTPIDTGSGIIYSSDGTIVTNNHVIAAAATAQSAQIQVKFSDGHTTSATIVGRDPSTDIAVIKVTNTGLTQAALGASSNLHVGDTVLALGSPLGLDGSVASGIVSALHRSVNLGSENQDNNPFGGSSSQAATNSAVTDAIQTDAAINPGNSGGPLVDITGKVVGINTAIASLGSSGNSQSGSIGVGFAIPIEEVQSVADQLIQGKTPQHAILGVSISDDPDGALVQNVTTGGAAEKAGLQEGDVITKFGSKSISGADQLSAAVRTNRPGDKVSVTYKRGGATKTTDVTLGSSND